MEMESVEIHEFMKLKKCTYEQVRQAFKKNRLTKKVVQLTGVLGGNRKLYVVKDEKFESWEAPKRKERVGLIKVKKGDCWTYRNDAMGVFCQQSVNTEIFQ